MIGAIITKSDASRKGHLRPLYYGAARNPCPSGRFDVRISRTLSALSRILREQAARHR
jgi:hypothetical protein